MTFALNIYDEDLKKEAKRHLRKINFDKGDRAIEHALQMAILKPDKLKEAFGEVGI